MEEAHVEQLREEAADARADEAVDHLRRRLGELLALDPVGGEDLTRGDGAVAGGDVDLAAEAWHQLALKSLEVVRLVPVVELEIRRARKGVEQAHVERRRGRRRRRRR